MLAAMVRVPDVEEERSPALTPALEADACRVPIATRDALPSPPPLPMADAVWIASMPLGTASLRVSESPKLITISLATLYETVFGSASSDRLKSN